MRRFGAVIFLLALAAAMGCDQCKRDPKVYVPGVVRVKFLMAVTPEEAKQLLTQQGYAAKVFGDEGWMFGDVTVGAGQECAEEKKLAKVTGVTNAAQLTLAVQAADEAKKRRAGLLAPDAGAP